MSAIIECEQVTKSYGDIAAVNDVSLSIDEGEIFGLVGPNGAGKTTLIEMIESLRTPDSGSIRVLGLNPAKDADELQERNFLLIKVIRHISPVVASRLDSEHNSPAIGFHHLYPDSA